MAASAAFLIAAFAAPVQAAYFPAGWNTTDQVTIDKDQVGLNFVMDFMGKASDDFTSQLSALGSFTFTGLTNSSKTWNFSYAITNDSNYDSRIRAFGFDTIHPDTPNPTSINGVSGFTYEAMNESFIEGVGTMDACFSAGSGCTSHSGSAGIYEGETENGTFSLTFANVMEEIDLNHFAMKFVGVSDVNGQNYGAGLGTLVSITPPGGGGGGGDPITAPEPGTWLMMLGGFGLVGSTMRRRRPASARSTAASAHRLSWAS